MTRKMLLGAGAAVAAALVAAAAYAGGGGTMGMGPARNVQRPAFQGYYDGHKDTYLNTDVSKRADATALHVNYAPLLAKVRGMPEIYLVEGRAAVGQLAVFGSEPGETNYSPLWAETLLTWKPSATPVVIKSDTQVNALEKQGKLTERDGHTVLNCPIVKVGK